MLSTSISETINLKLLCIADVHEVKGYDDLWILGDNFAATTFRPGFKFGCPDNTFIKANYEVNNFINSRYNSK